jgi:hypothetical protein
LKLDWRAKNRMGAKEGSPARGILWGDGLLSFLAQIGINIAAFTGFACAVHKSRSENMSAFFNN